MLLDLEKGIVRFKIVYYGIPKSGKTANLEKLSELEGLSMTKIDTKGDRTLVFDFSSKKVKVNDNLVASFALYTIPGQDIYTDIRLTVLKGVDGLVFVVDSQEERLQENIDFYSRLKEELPKVGKSFSQVSIIMQFNKLDLPNALSEERLNKEVNIDSLPSIGASALTGRGIRETFSILGNQLISKVKEMVR